MAVPRENRSLTAPLERRALPRMARALPAWVTPDSLTVLALLAALVGGIAYALAGRNLAWLHLASLAFVVHWFGDSLDGTLARVRHIRRERYGFFVDHAADALSAWFLLGGLAISGLVRPWLGFGLLACYLTHMLHATMVGLARGQFVLAPIGRIGPTELRLALIGMNTVVWATANPTLTGTWTLLETLLAASAVALLLGWTLLLVREVTRLSQDDPPPAPRPPAARSPREGRERTTGSRPARDRA